MWRAFFCALGISALILGGEFLVLERATLTLPPDPEARSDTLMGGVQEAFRTKEFVPPEWAPWTLLSCGAVIMLYASSVGKE
jgi:hypothetical protein